MEALPRQPAESSVPAPPRPHEGVSAEPRQPKVPRRQPPEAAAPSAPRPREASRERSPRDHSPALGDLLDPVVQSLMRRLASATEKSGDLRVQRGHRNFFVDKGELENFVGWTNDQQNEIAMSVEIDLPQSESEWKRILKCPMKVHCKISQQPTMTRRSRQLVLGLATHRRWRLWKADAKAAFLQGSPRERERNIFTLPVPELSHALGVPQGEAVRLVKAAYGLASAPRSWFLDVAEVLRGKCGLRQLKSDACTWIMDSPRGPIGAISLHVDDFLICGEEAEPCLARSAASAQGFLPLERLGKHPIRSLRGDD